MIGEIFPGMLVVHGISALWQGCRAVLAVSVLQTLHVLSGSGSEFGLAWCLCCPGPAEA